MHDYFYIREILNKLKIDEKLLKLSKLYAGKKVAFLGANAAFKILCEKFNLTELFDIVGVSDGNTKNIESVVDEFRVIPFENLYFSGIDLLINLKDDGKKIEKFLRSNNLIKKRVKFINLLEKSFDEKLLTYAKLSKQIFLTYKTTGQLMPIVKDLINYDCDVVESRLNYRKKAFDLSENTKEQIRVLFVVFDYKYWTLNNLYFKLRSDDNFKILPILVLPNSLEDNKYNSTEETLKYFKDNGYNCVDGIDSESDKAVMLEALKPDLIIYQQENYLKSNYIPSLISKYALTCYIDSEFKFESFNKLQTDRLSNTWKLYVSNKYAYRQFKEVVDIGLTSYEKYKDKVSVENENIWKNVKNANNNRIVYRPACDIDEDFDKQKFLETKEAIFKYVASHSQYSVVFIPDRDFKKNCINNDIFSEEEFNAYIENWKNLPNVTVRDVANVVSVYNSSDILLTDSVACAFEYFPCGKPVILTTKNQPQSLNSVSEKIFKTFYKIPSTEPLDIVLVDLLISKNDCYAKNRFAILSKFNDYFNSESSDLIIKDLKRSLGRLEID